MTADPTEATGTSGLSSRTIGGTLAFCEWIKRSHYISASGAETLKSAVKSVFSTVEPDNYEAISLDGLDVDEYVRD